MVFTTTNLFKGIPCPTGEECRLTNCIFNHNSHPESTSPDFKQAATDVSAHAGPLRSDEPPAKRRRIANEIGKTPSKADQIREELAAARFTSLETSTQHSAKPNKDVDVPLSLRRSVSPPALGSRPTTLSQRSIPNNIPGDTSQRSRQSTSRPDTAPEEGLNPRLLANDPVGHSKRTLYLKHLHSELVRLNTKVGESDDEDIKRVCKLSEQELIRFALAEEEKLALAQPKLYSNIIKQRIVSYKKMTVEDWITRVKAYVNEKVSGRSESNSHKQGEIPIHTDLPLDQEHLILLHLVADQSRLSTFGYIPTPPSEADADEARAAVQASRNYEICDRCSARFQVFPDRDEDGNLASNGPCKHHPNRKVFPPKTKNDYNAGPKEPYYPCCNELVGSPGCTRSDNHVFKASAPARLAAVLPFITTPENPKPAKDRQGNAIHAVAFDCEMGYTVFGMELIRLTAVSWPSGDELLDILVRPLGAVIDLNSRYSGVRAEHFAAALPYSASANPPPQTLLVVPSPAAARELLCTFLQPSTPLLGHAIDNDLNAVRLCHPTIVDTVLLFSHPRGLPMRFGLKMLTSRYLGKQIQMGGAMGHDSLEDARATGELVRVKVGEKWRGLRAAGWRIEDGMLVAPPGGGANMLGSGEVSIGRKRRRSSGDDGSAIGVARYVQQEVKE